MRALLTTIGSRGDVQPLIALGAGLRRSGHVAHLCAPPDFGDWAIASGLDFTPVGPSVRAFAAARPMGAALTPPTPEQRRMLAEGTVGAQWDALMTAARGCDVIVAASALQVVARSVAEHLGVPYVFVAYSATVLPSAHHPPPALPGQDVTGSIAEQWTRDAERFTALFGPPLERRRAELGLAPVGDVRAHMLTTTPWLAADPMLGPWPEDDGTGVFQTGAWLLEDARPLPDEVHAFLADGPPPVYIGFGSTRAPGDAAALIGDLVRLGDWRVIASGGWFDDALVAGDGHCLPIGDTNLWALLPRVAAAVHHGGAGTTTAAALSGAPQVVLPQHYDQHYWARQVERLGVGVAHAPQPPTAASLHAALTRVRDASVVSRAASLAPSMRRDGVAVAIAALEALTTGS